MCDRIDSKAVIRAASCSGSGLILLGTVHSDPKGFSRTSAFLKAYRPDLIFVEISVFAIAFRKERSRALRKIFLERIGAVSHKLGIDPAKAIRHPQIASILLQISLPFEYRASTAYAMKEGCKLIPVDYSEFSRQWIDTWPEMISEDNIEHLLGLEKSRPRVSSQYAQAARRIKEDSLCGEIRQQGNYPGWQERENHIAAEITSALELFKPDRSVYIGGWWHLSIGGEVKTVRELLNIREADCRLLDRGRLSGGLSL